ncbi:hypothetical protein SAMN05216403_10783 [Nitrosospira multiformis ATCC 25196]|uniref:Uncharacterized protein n=1 Tax=Nitrosospira multiformis (strain ATCC 25196 / NCIMB 11849 / C 71) TaxID=323848 RepID=A0A1H5UH47_NITMU|nr:hypothetical protein SAMN05216403_10783 [Nitrosospira multiformis ATCC 25196]
MIGRFLAIQPSLHSDTRAPKFRNVTQGDFPVPIIPIVLLRHFKAKQSLDGTEGQHQRDHMLCG